MLLALAVGRHKRSVAGVVDWTSVNHSQELITVRETRKPRKKAIFYCCIICVFGVICGQTSSEHGSWCARRTLRTEVASDERRGKITNFFAVSVSLRPLRFFQKR